MKFAKIVRNKNIPWVTQRNFSREKWIEVAQNAIEDETDKQIYNIGLWAEQSFSYIRERVFNSELWSFPKKKLARLFVAFANSDAKIAQVGLTETLKEEKLLPASFYDELVYKNTHHDIWGSQKISSLLDSVTDSVNLCLNFLANPPKNIKQNLEPDVSEAHLLINYAGLYKIIEDVFYEVVWSDWVMEEREDCWLLKPKDVQMEAIYAASLQRHDDLSAQIVMSAAELWRKSPETAKSIFNSEHETPIYQLSNKNNMQIVHYQGKQQLDSPPVAYLFRAVVSDLYYLPLINTKLAHLSDMTILDLLRVFVEVRQICSLVFESISPDKSLTFNYTYLVNHYCPLVNRKSIITAIAEYLQMSTEKVTILVDALTWTKDKQSIWFCPLISQNTENGLGIFFVYHPLSSVNLYWLVDYWITTYGLPLDVRGKLFEEHITEFLKREMDDFQFRNEVKIWGSTKITATDNSFEEFDLLIKIKNTLVIGEAKCQKFPITPIERANYSQTLSKASEQILRKVEWVKNHLEQVRNSLNIEVDQIKNFEPVIISNHSLGVGWNFSNVPVVDMLFLVNYFARPFRSTGVMDKSGTKEIRGEPFYKNAGEMETKIGEYLKYPHPIYTILSLYEPKYIYFPIGLEKPLAKVEFAIDTSKFPS